MWQEGERASVQYGTQISFRCHKGSGPFLGWADEGRVRCGPGMGAKCMAEALSLGLGPGLVEPVDVVDNADGTQTVNYVPSREGPYSISVLYGEEEVPRR